MSKIDKVKLSQVRKLIKGQVDLETYGSVKARIAECYHRPDNVDLTLAAIVDLTLTAINEVLGGYGVEAIRGSWGDRYYGDCCALYVNMGDTYDQTVVYDTRKGKYEVISWGDWVESAPKYYGVI